MNARNLLIVTLTGVAVLAAGLVFLTRHEPLPPSPVEIAALAETGNIDAAEAKIDLLLKRTPGDPGVHLLAAQIKMAKCEQVTHSGVGTDPTPASSALEHLRRIETRDKKLAALAKLWQGKAERYLGQLDEAEEAWLEALRLDPIVPEAGWLLLQEYYLQGRAQEARALALRLHQSEPDSRDRIRFLLEPLRQEVMPPDASSLVLWFEPIASHYPKGLRANTALGLALVRSGEANRGMDLLRKMVEIHPQRPEAWNTLLAGLDEVGDVKELSGALRHLPGAYSTAPWIARYQGRVAEVGGDWEQASCNYRRALQESPAEDRLIYRLARTLRQKGEKVEANQLSERHRSREALNQEARTLYEKAVNDGSLGIAHHPELYEEIAALRDKMGYPEQAKAWHRLAESLHFRN